MIVGTAGHIDHGKTTLVRALTGVDTDRLSEEKQRGISIELGYAFLDTPTGARIGFVDVPGHERLVHTMLAGATGIDHALLLVAADDGVMPQTREHLAVLSLLAQEQGTVVLTKSDRATPEQLNAVTAEVGALLADSPLREAPLFTVSAQTGEGLPALRQHLLTLSAHTVEHPRSAATFRLAVDRVFTLDGLGTVVTGTVHAGRVQVGDELHLVPGVRVLRVRSLHAQNRAVSSAQAGQRCAVVLAGLPRDGVARGQWLVGAAAATSTTRLDVALTLWHAEMRALRSGTSVHVHIGSSSVMGTVALLDPLQLEPGQSGLAQLVLREPVGAWYGDRIVLRDASARRTVAGGQVLDPQAPVRYRRTPQRLAELSALSRPSLSERLNALLLVAPQGLDLHRFEAAQGMPLTEALTEAMGTLDGAVLQQHGAHSHYLLHPTQVHATSERLSEALMRFHQLHPDELGPDSARLRRLALPRLPEPLWRALLVHLQTVGVLCQRGAFVHLPEHGIQLSATEERLAQSISTPLLEAGFEGAWVRDLARDSREPEVLVRMTLTRLAQRGELHQVVKDLYYPPATMARLAALAREIAGEQDTRVTAATFRDATQLGRKRAIQILEHFDRIGLLRRVGDVHCLRADCELFREMIGS